MSPITFAGSPPSIVWCGPAALSILTGRTYEEAANALQRIMAMKEITYSHDSALMLALGEFGYKAAPVALGDRYTTAPTLGRYLEERPNAERAVPLMVFVTEHVLCAHMNWLCDSQRQRPVQLGAFPGLRRRVRVVAMVTPWV